ncbi:hypothetical protein [Rhizobium sp. Rhizsp82]|uniref:hypothetical protein n=1 Tax=Rhizobium sp. Rhizsp82 TaxID=3243057 RepID=UPI0039B50866
MLSIAAMMPCFKSCWPNLAKMMHTSPNLNASGGLMVANGRLALEFAMLAATVVSAGVAVWQAYEAASSSDSAQQAAMLSQRTQLCLAMNEDVDNIMGAPMWSLVMKKPYTANKDLKVLTAKVKLLAEHARIFRQTTPTEEAKKFWDTSTRLGFQMGDMILDGGDYLTEEELTNGLADLSINRQNMCDRLYTSS